MLGDGPCTNPCDHSRMKPATSTGGPEIRETEADASAIDQLLGSDEGTAQAATRSVALEEALRRERSLLRALIDSLPASICAKDVQSRFIACNALADECIRHLATHDGLTDLPNRPAFNEALSAAVADARDRGSRFVMLFVDLDHFRLINDSLGHAAGDELLLQTAMRLRACVHAGDFVARLGGDEFALLCKDPTELHDVAGLASRVLQATSRPVALLGHQRRVSASVGVAVYPDDGDNERTLMKSADSAMYTAKQDGRSGYRLFSRRLRASNR